MIFNITRNLLIYYDEGAGHIGSVSIQDKDIEALSENNNEYMQILQNIPILDGVPQELLDPLPDGGLWVDITILNLAYFSFSISSSERPVYSIISSTGTTFMSICLAIALRLEEEVVFKLPTSLLFYC